MADLNLLRLVIGSQGYAIPDASKTQKGLMSTADFDKLSKIADGAQVNVIEEVQVNGEKLSPTDKKVNITVATGDANGTLSVNGKDVSVKGLAAMAYKGNVSETELESTLAQKINGKANASDVYTQEEINSKLSAVYKPAGSIDAEHIPTPVVGLLGHVYNVTESFTTDNTFVDNSGKTYPAGTNIVVIEYTPAKYDDQNQLTQAAVYKLDVLAGFVDLSGKADNDHIHALATAPVAASEGNDGSAGTNGFMSAADKGKLDGIAAGATANTVSYDADTATLTFTGFTDVTPAGED